MLFRQLFDHESSTYTYLLAEDFGKEAVIIDPVKQHVERYVKLIKELDLILVAAIDTHLHADHITGLGLLQQQLGCRLLMGKESQTDCLSARLSDGDIIDFGRLKLTAVHTPGHTDDSYCYLMDDRLFTGDTLLIRGTGRTDFQNGNPQKAYESLQRILALPDAVLVYPAHDYQGMTVSTIREEKQFNPRLQVSSCEEYIELMKGLNLPYPKLIDVAVPANRNCGI